MKPFLYSVLLSVALFFLSCGGAKKNDPNDSTPGMGKTRIMTEDGLQPIVKQSVEVYEAQHPDVSITVEYSGEPQMLNALFDDSVRLVIAARDLTQQEVDGVKARKSARTPRSILLAYDAIALIVNKSNPDTLLTLPVLKKIITGEITSWKQINKNSPLGDIHILLDNPNSSIARYLQDSLCAPDSLNRSILRAAQNNTQVLERVSQNRDALGLIGLSWLSNPDDTTNLSFTSRVKVVALAREVQPEEYFLPYQYYIAESLYPLERKIYAILTDSHGTLNAGIYNFMASETGQRIIYRQGLLPARVQYRMVSVKDEFD